VPGVVEQSRAADRRKPYLIAAAAIVIGGMAIWAAYQNIAASKAREQADSMIDTRDQLAPLKQDIDSLLKKETSLRQIASGYTNAEADHAFWMDTLAELRGAFASDAVWLTDLVPIHGFDPAKALDGFLQPMGGYKGYGLALMVDLLAGVMSDAAYLTHVKSWVDAPDEPQNLGHFFLLMDTKVLGPSGWLLSRMKDFLSILHASEPANPERPVLVPGEMELARMRDRLRDGIEVDAAVMRLLG
jgi:hypothetical protein